MNPPQIPRTWFSNINSQDERIPIIECQDVEMHNIEYHNAWGTK
jgi:hypothetical protein